MIQDCPLAISSVTSRPAEAELRATLDSMRTACAIGLLLAATLSVSPAVAATFSRLEEIAIPGPALEPGPRLIDGRVECPVADGIASAPLGEGADATVTAGEPADQLPLEERWSLSADGRFRARIIKRRFVEFQKKCKRCRRGWRRRWKARLPAGSIQPPVVGEDHVFVGTMGNHVHALKAAERPPSLAGRTQPPGDAPARPGAVPIR